MVRQFLGTAAFQMIGKALTLLTGIILARVLGPDEYGVYGFVISLVTICVIPTIAGVPQLLIREISIFLSNQDYGKLKGIINWSNIYTGLASLLIIFVMYISIRFNWIDSKYHSVVFIGAALVPLRGYISKSTAIINALKSPQLAQIPANIIWPLMVLIIVLIMYFNSWEINSQNLIIVQFLSILVSLIFSLLLIYVKTNSGGGGIKAEYKVSYWHRSLIPFTLVYIFTSLNAELATVFLGFLSSTNEVGFFKVSAQGGAVILMFIQSINAITSPKIAPLYRLNNLSQLQKMLSSSVRLTFFISLPVFGIFVFLGGALIRFVFGDGYASSELPLIILSLSYMISVIVGPVGGILNMTGNEKYCLISLVFSSVINFILLWLLSPQYGSVGASLSVLVSSVIYNLTMVYFVKRRTGLVSWLNFNK